jgi:hypothetical protein
VAASAQPKPVASAQISATRGEYRADLDDWEVRLQRSVQCSGGDGFVWSVFLRGKAASDRVRACELRPR